MCFVVISVMKMFFTSSLFSQFLTCVCSIPVKCELFEHSKPDLGTQFTGLELLTMSSTSFMTIMAALVALTAAFTTV